VCVYNIKGNTLEQFVTWGDNGLAANPLGFNNPKDLHIDSNNGVWIADTGNNCIKNISIIGNPIKTIIHEVFENNPPLSVCVDAILNVHCLTQGGVFVFDKSGTYQFKYEVSQPITLTSKINSSYNREIIYVSHQYGVAKYFRNGSFFSDLIKDYTCEDGGVITGYSSINQDGYRNVYVVANDKVFKFGDLQQITKYKALIPNSLYWPLSSLKVHKEEYIQPWVYLKSFHRLWDNTELLRTSLFYNTSGCKTYIPPTFSKEDIIIGQNELVSNSVINRIAEQVWTNVQSLVDYFNPDCEK
jgi:hypothetical protein